MLHILVFVVIATLQNILIEIDSKVDRVGFGIRRKAISIGRYVMTFTSKAHMVFTLCKSILHLIPVRRHEYIDF